MKDTHTFGGAPRAVKQASQRSRKLSGDRARALLVSLCFVAAAAVGADPAVTHPMTGEPVICPILIYHAVREYLPGDSPAARRYITTPETFTAEMQFLKDSGTTPVSFAQLADAVENGDALPTNPVIISFDDGWENQYENALPVLMRFGYRATFFIFTNGIGARHFMDAGQIRTLAADGMEIGSHSRSHPYLARINDEGTLRAEILGSRLKLEALLGRPVTAFAYPFGHATPRIVEMVREAGYRSARSTYPGIRHGRRDLFDLTGLIDVTSIAKVEAGVRAAEMAGLPRDLRSGAPRNGPVS